MISDVIMSECCHMYIIISRSTKFFRNTNVSVATSTEFSVDLPIFFFFATLMTKCCHIYRVFSVDLPNFVAKLVFLAENWPQQYKFCYISEEKTAIYQNLLPSTTNLSLSFNQFPSALMWHHRPPPHFKQTKIKNNS